MKLKPLRHGEMMHYLRHRLANAAFTLIALLCTWPLTLVHAAEEYSEANQLLFMTPHLNLLDRAGTTVIYRYQSSGTGTDESFSDQIRLRITSVEDDGFRSVDVQFFSGDRERYFPPMERLRGNPVLTAFLQYDINRMGRHAGAPPRYFQDRIKIALEESAVVTDTTLHFNGAEISGKKIRVAPYGNSPDKSRYDSNYWQKHYTFIVSDDIPGYIYRIEAIAPGNRDEVFPEIDATAMPLNDSAGPWQQDTLILESVKMP